MDGWTLDLKGQFVLTLQNTPLLQQELLTPKSERKKRGVGLKNRVTIRNWIEPKSCVYLTRGNGAVH